MTIIIIIILIITIITIIPIMQISEEKLHIPPHVWQKPMKNCSFSHNYIKYIGKSKHSATDITKRTVELLSIETGHRNTDSRETSI